MWQLPRLRITLIALTALAGVVTGCAVDPMERLSQDVEVPDVAIRERAIYALANLSDSRAIRTLLEVLESDEQMYDLAAVALVKKGRELSERPKTNPVVEEVTELLGKQHLGEPFRARAAWVLGEIGDRAAIPALRTASGAGPGLSLVVDQANQSLEKLGDASQGCSYEIPLGTLRGAVEVLPQIEPLPVIETGESSG